TVQLALDEPLHTIVGDPDLLETAFKHLMNNAVHFNKKGGLIKLQAKNQGDQVQISFADTGIGIPNDKVSMVFDSFYQVADYMTRDVGGIGLGLAIVRRIVEAHGGSIMVQSREGQGSEFRILLPQPKRAAAQDLKQAKEAKAWEGKYWSLMITRIRSR